MSNVLIDLGEVPKRREGSAAIAVARPPIPYRLVLGALSVVLLLSLAGAGHRTPQAPPTIIPAQLGDNTFVDGDRLFVVSAGRATLGSDVLNRTISTYSLPAARLLSTSSVAVSGAITWVWESAGVVVVSYQVENTGAWAVAAVQAGTGTTLWRRSARWIGGSAADRLVILDSEAAELGVALGTGEVRWTIPRPPGGYTAAAGADDGIPHWLITVADTGTLETRDARTARPLARAKVAPMRDRMGSLMFGSGDLILLDAGSGGYDAYRLPGLEKAWHTTADLAQSWSMGDCGRVVCTFREQRGVTALDPATGRELWVNGRWAYAQQAGAYLIATDGEQVAGQPAFWVLDPDTGRTLGNFGDWQALAPGRPGPIYGMLTERGTHKILYGVLDPATRSTRILGSADDVSNSCETGTGVLICRLVDASIALWPLR